MKTLLAVLPGVAAIALAAPDEARAQGISAEEAALLREEVALLKARIGQLEQRLAAPGGAPPPPPAPPLAAAPPAAAAAAAGATKGELQVEWRGSPRLTQGGRAFKVKGRIQADANYVAAPAGLNDPGLGFSAEFRRIRLGGEGKLGGGFGYKLELELSDNTVDLVDSYLTYERGSWLLALGNQNPFQSLDELTGDTSGSFMERAAFTDAFNFERRLGLSAQYRTGALLAQIGVFSDDAGSLANSSDGPAGGDENNSFSIDGRVVFAPKLGSAQLHFGGSAHWRELGRLADGPQRYRQRPYVHSANTRLIGTPGLAVLRERSFGIEFGAVRGPWHAAVEGHWLQADRLGAAPARFRGGYAEIGYFLTRGDSRPYDRGIFGAGAPKHPLGNGGIGSVQFNVRYDFLDLNSGDIRGGTQDAYLAGLIWTPIQYVRFNFNYGYVRYTGAAPLADGRRDYGLQVFGSRFEVDF